MSRPVAVVFSVLAGLQIITGSTLLAKVVGPEKAALAALAVGAATAGMAWYVQSQVTSNSRVAVTEPTPGRFIAGQAGPVAEGTKVEAPKPAGPALSPRLE